MVNVEVRRVEGFLLRWIFTGLAAGALGVLLTRQIAHWTDQDSWTIRGVAYVILGFGILGLALTLSVSVALKVLAAAVALSLVMLWIDKISDAGETALAEERMERFFGGDEQDKSRLGPPPRQTQPPAQKAPQQAAPEAPDVAAAASSAVGATCPGCRAKIRPGQSVAVCPQCGSPHHSSCWKAKGCQSTECAAG